MAAVRLDDNADNIANTLAVALVDTTIAAKKNIKSFDPLASSTWEEVSSENTLITPVQCKSIWRQFKSETEYSVSQAISAQEANKRNNTWLPPPWAILALLILGFNEFMTLLRNPLYLFVIFVGFLLFKALWVQLDITTEFSHGVLPGLISISTKLIPTVMNLLKKLAEEGHMPESADPQRVGAADQSTTNVRPIDSDSASSSSFSRSEVEHSDTLHQRRLEKNWTS